MTVPHITVCVCTYQRSTQLDRLLKALMQQEGEGLFTYSVVVADNDAAESASTVVAAYSSAVSPEITYCVEARRGIAVARNAALAHAKGEFVAFVDDDEIPSRDWLTQLFRACQATGADGVLGPVVPLFDESPPAWLKAAGLFDRPRHETGCELKWEQTRTGNVLLRHHVFPEKEASFNPQFLSGSDQEFFRRRIAEGYRFLWCDEAVVTEVVPRARWKRKFLVRRALFRGIFSFHNRPTFAAVGYSTAAAAAYTFILPWAILLGQARFMSYAFSLTYHIGRILGVFGINPIKQPYVVD